MCMQNTTKGYTLKRVYPFAASYYPIIISKTVLD